MVYRVFEGIPIGLENRLFVMSIARLINDPSRWPLSHMPVKRERAAVGHIGIDYEFGLVCERDGKTVPVVFLPDFQINYGSVAELVDDGWRPD